MSGTWRTRSVGTTARKATTPVKRGLSAPNRAARTTEWMPSAPMSASSPATSLPSVKAMSTPCPVCVIWLARLPNCTWSSGKASARAASRSARWMVSWGAPYLRSASSPMVRREVSSPVSQLRLMRCVGRAALARTAAAMSAPRPSRARTALGVRLMSAPTRRNCRLCSNTNTSCPAWCSALAAASPPMPAPTMPILKRAMVPVSCWWGLFGDAPRDPERTDAGHCLFDRPRASTSARPELGTIRPHRRRRMSGRRLSPRAAAALAPAACRACGASWTGCCHRWP